MSKDRSLREQLAKLLDWQGAHVTLEDTLKGWPVELRGKLARGVPYTAWQLLEHMRIAQWDILEFSRDANHVSPEWPKGYWPSIPSPSSNAAWQQSLRAFKRDRSAMQKLVLNPKTDLFSRIPHGDGQTILREVVLTADHNAYHLGQLVLLRRLLGAWGKGH